MHQCPAASGCPSSDCHGVAATEQPIGEGQDHQRYTRSRTTPEGLASYESADTPDNQPLTASTTQQRQFTLADYFTTSATLTLKEGSPHQLIAPSPLEQPVHGSRTERQNIPLVNQHIEQDAGMQRFHPEPVSRAQEGPATPCEGCPSTVPGIHVMDQHWSASARLPPRTIF
jgi:hypothetical protein